MPSGPCITRRHTPPGRTSLSWMVFVKPSGPHHCATCLGSVHASNACTLGASTTRVVTISRSVVLLASSCSAAMSVVAGLVVRGPEVLSRRRRRGGFPGALRGYGVVERPVEPPEHLAIGQLGQQPVHRLVQ